MWDNESKLSGGKFYSGWNVNKKEVDWIKIYIGFYKDIEIIYWTVNWTLDGLDFNLYQSTSGTKIEANCLPGKSRIALFWNAVITFTFVELLIFSEVFTVWARNYEPFYAYRFMLVLQKIAFL